MENKNKIKIILGLIIGIIIITLLISSMGTISAGERGIRTKFGAIQGTVPQGLYFKLPFIEKSSQNGC